MKLKEKIQTLEAETHLIRLQMVQEIKKLDSKLNTTFEVTHAGKTRLFTIDSNGNIKKENQVIKA